MAFELIEASAGTGKTYSITSRYLELVLGHGLAVDQILVVTFTEAATAELRDRIRLRIREVRDLIEGNRLGSLEDPVLRARLEGMVPDAASRERAVKRLTNAIISFDEAAIFTIHGFCTRILREQAFATGMDFSADVITDDMPVLEEVVADFCRAHLDALTPEEFGWCTIHGTLFGGTRENNWRVTGRLMTPKELHALHRVIVDPLVEITPPVITLAAARKTKDPQTVALAVTHDLIAFARTGLVARKKEMRVMSFGDMLVLVHDALTGPGGGTLAAGLRQAYQAALIDEFQDTDPLQYDILRLIYEGTDLPVVFVGDPKQAIYSFRGGDITTYFRATATIPEEEKKTLSVNFRSAADLVDAVSALFLAAGTTAPFADGGKTRFPAVSAHHAAGKEPRTIHDAGPRGALHWLILPGSEGAGKETSYTWTKGAAEAAVLEAVVREIGDLISHRKTDPSSLRPSDIAVLVRSHLQARAVQDALLEASIPCIVKTLASVYRSVSAGELLALLRAVTHPGNDADVTGALLTPSLGYTAAELLALKQDAGAYGAIAERLIAIRTLWEASQNGFMRMSTALLHEPGLAQGGMTVAARLLRFADAERRLTDLLHLIELLHQESILHPGHDHLVHWLELQIAEAEEENEEVSIRLESDAERVQIVTVHMSKGLEYPVVFCPFTFDGKAFKPKDDPVVFFHREAPAGSRGTAHVPVLTADIGSPEQAEHFQKRVEEARSESIRHLYVALTRARQRCYVVWGHVNNMEDAALTYLLFDEAKRDRKSLSAAGHQGIMAPVLRLIKASKGAMKSSVIGSGTGRVTADHVVVSGPSSLAPREFTRPPLRPSWSYASYTSLTNDWVHSARDTDAVVAMPPARHEGNDIYAFPAGARTGKAWHAFFEHLPFEAGPGEIADAVAAMLTRYGFAPAFQDAMTAMVQTALHTPLGPAGVTLASVDARSAARELDFVFSCEQFRTADFRALLSDPRSGLPASFAAASSSLRDRDIQGFMLGTIDLLFRHEGRFYILDYKSNTLGATSSHYAPSMLPGVMAREHYYLQYLIYTVAVHRYLRTRVPDYDYETHYGGAIYMFLRGLEAGTDNGIFFDRPSAALIAELEARLFRREEG